MIPADQARSAREGSRRFVESLAASDTVARKELDCNRMPFAIVLLFDARVPPSWCSIRVSGICS